MVTLDKTLEGVTLYFLDLEKFHIESNSKCANAPAKARNEHANTLKLLQRLDVKNLIEEMTKRYENTMGFLFHDVLTKELNDLNNELTDCKKIYRLNSNNE
jgi:hypothetical protein